MQELKLQTGEGEFALPRNWNWDQGHQGQITRDFCKGIAVSSIRFHNLRATFITQMLSNGVARSKVLAIVGHSSLKTTQGYLRLCGKDVEGATEDLNIMVPEAKALGKVIDFKRSVGLKPHLKVLVTVGHLVLFRYRIFNGLRVQRRPIHFFKRAVFNFKGFKEMADVRWQQRLQNFKSALTQLAEAVQISKQRPLSNLEKQGMIQAFEFSHELAWNVIKDYFEYQGNTTITGSRDATREAFKMGIIRDGDPWMEMIKSRNQTTHTYNKATADDICKKTVDIYYPLFEELKSTFESLIAK